jgi:hypothetical protein
MCVPPKTWNKARKPLLDAIYSINIILYSKEANRPQRKQLLPLVPKEAIAKEVLPLQVLPLQVEHLQRLASAPLCKCPPLQVLPFASTDVSSAKLSSQMSGETV